MTFPTLRLRLLQLAYLPSVLLVIATLTVRAIFRRNWCLRYELAIEVETPTGPRRGSSIIEVIVRRSVPFWGANGINFGIAGRAPSAELPDGRLVFVLLHDATNVGLARLAAEDADFIPGISDRIRRMNTGTLWSYLKAKRPVLHVDAATMSRRTKTYPGATYPDLVVLDPAHPTSIRAIDPANPELGLGRGFRVVGITLSVVDALPDTAFDLPWLPGISSALDRVATSTGPLRNGLRPSRFIAP